MCDDLALVEERLVRAMQEPRVNQALVHTLQRLRLLRGMVAGIKATHAEVASSWSNIAAAARGQTCCLNFLKRLQAVATANEGSWPFEAEGLDAAGEEFSRQFWASDTNSLDFEQLSATLSTDGDVDRSDFLGVECMPKDSEEGESSATSAHHLLELQARQNPWEPPASAAAGPHVSNVSSVISSRHGSRSS